MKKQNEITAIFESLLNEPEGKAVAILNLYQRNPDYFTPAAAEAIGAFLALAED